MSTEGSFSSDCFSRLSQATDNRPTLIERHDAELRKEKARRTALASIAGTVCGVRTLQDHTTRGWTECSMVDSIFDEDEKATLGISQQLTAQ